MAKKKKEKEPADDWILKEVASRGVFFRIFASIAAITNGIAIGVIISIFFRLGLTPDLEYVSWFKAAALAVDVGVTLLLVVAFMLGMEEFDGSGPVIDAKGNVVVPESGGEAKKLRQARIDAKKARKEAKKRAKEEKKKDKKKK